MSSLIDTFKKQGGFRLIKEYWRAGVLWYVIPHILLMGKSLKSLELLRLSIALKIRNKLKKKFLPALESFDKSFISSTNSTERSKKVWICWLQGMENAPAIVQKCYKSIVSNLKDREIILLTSENISDYISLPDYILEKYNKKIISNAHYADIIRVELLCKYGGTWIDSTVLCTSGNVPSYMLDSDFFVFQNLKPGADGSVDNTSNWFITACKNNKFMLAQRALLFAYWKKYNYTIDYFFYHHFISIISEYYSEDWKKIVQFPNSFPHILLLMLFDEFNQEKWDAVTASCPFHKLAYKRSEEDMAKEGTYYKHIMNI